MYTLASFFLCPSFFFSPELLKVRDDDDRFWFFEVTGRSRRCDLSVLFAVTAYIHTIGPCLGIYSTYAQQYSNRVLTKQCIGHQSTRSLSVFFFFRDSYLFGVGYDDEWEQTATNSNKPQRTATSSNRQHQAPASVGIAPTTSSASNSYDCVISCIILRGHSPIY